LILVFTSLSYQLSAQKKQKAFIDTLDNALDVSYYLSNLNGLLPIVSPITEPAVGYGAVAAGLFFIEKKEKKEKKFQIPDIAAVAGGYTESATWFAGGGYIGFWKDDRIRYRGVFGYGDIKLKYYGNGSEFLANHPAKFNIHSIFFLQQLVFRLGESDFLLGGKYQLGKSKITFLENSPFPIIKPQELEFTNSGIGLIAEYESLNTIFSPTKGIRANITYNQFLTVLGGDRDFGVLSAYFIYHHHIIKDRWHGAYRTETQFSVGKTPFYMKPFVFLRGVPAMRYQGQLTALIETEQEFSLTKRWSLVGFGGYGHAFKDFDNMDIGSDAWSAGAGFRYMIARLFGLKMGVDVARGPEQWALYVVFGNSWIR